jgi:putative ABC transport system substrate-binding protein
MTEASGWKSEVSKILTLRPLLLALSFSGALLLALCISAEAQQPTKIPRIGYLTAGFISPPTREEAFRQGLREFGYVEGKNILIEFRWADGKHDRLRGLALELVRLPVNIIVTGGPTATLHAKEATATIPIVMAQDGDPVRNGFVASLARPGGNITGLSSYSAELNGKRLELLKEIVPKLSRVAVLGDSNNPGNSRAVTDAEKAASALGVQTQYLDVRDPKALDSIRSTRKGRLHALLVLNFPAGNQDAAISKLALENRLPAVYYNSAVVGRGGLMSYGASIADLDRRAARYVDKILKGAKPADLPVEQPTKFELVINLKTAKQIGLTIPPNVLARADRVIK